MKKIAVVAAFCLLIGVVVFVSFRSKAKTQLPVQTSSSVTWNKQTNDVTLVADQLQVKFDEAFAAIRWRVGVHVADVSKATLTVGLLSLKSDISKPFLKQIESIANWPQAGIQKEVGKIEYLGAPETDSIAVHVVLPRNARLQIDAGAKTLFSSAVSRDILIDEKGVSEQTMKSMAALMAVTLITPLTSVPDVVVNASGAKLVSLANLKAHLQTSTRPRFPAGVQIDQPEQVFIKGTITTEGKVINATATRGSQVFAASCLTALEAWRFRPFVIDGVKSEVIGMFVFGFDPNGTVLSPALGDGRL